MSDQSPPAGTAALTAHCPTCKQPLPTSDLGWQLFIVGGRRSPSAHIAVTIDGEFQTACGGWHNADTAPAPDSMRKCKRCIALTTEPERHPLQISAK